MFSKQKRALSPVLATILVFVLLLAAISIVWTYVLPAYDRLLTQKQTNNAFTSLAYIDDTVRSMVSSQPEQAAVLILYNDNGIFSLDSRWSFTFWLNDSSGQQVLQSGTHGWFSYSLHNPEPALEVKTHKYLKGPLQQDYWGLNYSDPLAYSDISIFNYSYPLWGDGDEVVSLSYRTTVVWNSSIDGINPPSINVQLTTIRIMGYGKNSTSRPSLQLRLNFNESKIVYEQTLSRTGAYHLFLNITDPLSKTHMETLLTHDFAEYTNPLTQAYTITIKIVELRIYCTLL